MTILSFTLTALTAVAVTLLVLNIKADNPRAKTEQALGMYERIKIMHDRITGRK